jgi:cystathionine beta-synthase
MPCDPSCGGSFGSAVYGALQYAKNLPEDKLVVVILPDSGSRYLSKVFNDDWMRENRFLDFPLAEGRVEDILAHKQMDIITLRKSDLKTQVIARMKQYNISQLPVVEEDGRYVGMVTELDLLNHLLAADHKHDSEGEEPPPVLPDGLDCVELHCPDVRHGPPPSRFA